MHLLEAVLGGDSWVIPHRTLAKMAAVPPDASSETGSLQTFPVAFIFRSGTSGSVLSLDCAVFVESRDELMAVAIVINRWLEDASRRTCWTGLTLVTAGAHVTRSGSGALGCFFSGCWLWFIPRLIWLKNCWLFHPPIICSSTLSRTNQPTNRSNLPLSACSIARSRRLSTLKQLIFT
jgi:hypothetical protein